MHWHFFDTKREFFFSTSTAVLIALYHQNNYYITNVSCFFFQLKCKLLELTHKYSFFVLISFDYEYLWSQNKTNKITIPNSFKWITNYIDIVIVKNIGENTIDSQQQQKRVKREVKENKDH